MPPGCESPASSDLTACQAFRAGAAAYGLLFYMEVTAALGDGMAGSFPDELAGAGGDVEELYRGGRELLPALISTGDRFFSGWAR